MKHIYWALSALDVGTLASKIQHMLSLVRQNGEKVLEGDSAVG